MPNTGTCLDTPAHRFRNGHNLAGHPLEGRAQLRSVVVDAGDGPIGLSAFSDVEAKGATVLIANRLGPALGHRPGR